MFSFGLWGSKNKGWWQIQDNNYKNSIKRLYDSGYKPRILWDMEMILCMWIINLFAEISELVVERLSPNSVFQFFPGIGQEGPAARIALRQLKYNDSGAENPNGMLWGDRLDLDDGDRLP